MKTFLIIWFGQLISRVGTAMTRFALLIWAYEQTGSATSVALLGFAAFLPMILISPFAGVWIDRIDRRKVLIFSDLGAGVMTIAMLILAATNNLQLWHLYLVGALAGAFEAFQIPAYTAVMSTLLPKNQYSRANGLRSLADFGSQVLAPALGGLCLVWMGLSGVMLIDVVTFLAAVGTLLVVRIPAVKDTAVSGQAAFRQDLRVGFATIWQHKGLVTLVSISSLIHFFAALTWLSILPAMILARSGSNELALASVQSAIGIGGLLGGVVMTLWGGPRRKIHGFLLGVAFSFLLGDIPLAIGRTLPVWVLAAGTGSFFIPILGSSQETIWQTKIPQAMQGRVFSVRQMLVNALLPAGYLLGGVLADQVMEPAMAVNGALVSTFGWLVGTGPGAGMALMFIGSSTLAILVCLLAYLFPAVRHVEDETLPVGTTAVIPAAVTD
jgi:MFS transporter, DHA3 family, macrolide efflux protein